MTENQIKKELQENEAVKIAKDDKIKGLRLLIGYLGIFVTFVGLAMMLPSLVALFYREEVSYIKYFIIPGSACVIGGLILYCNIVKKSRSQLKKGEDSVLLVSIWIVSTILCSIPFMYGLNMNFTHAIFETTSGLTTTGLTVVKPESTPRMFLMYRSLLQFLGGVGLVLIITATISDRYGLRLYSAEGHGDKLLPNMAKSARMILGIYVIYILLGTVAYSILGMPVFDSLNHSISAIATGGFSVKNASIGAYAYLGEGRFLGIQIVSCVLMILGSTNFLVHAYLFRRKFKNALMHSEHMLVLINFLIAVPIFIIPLRILCNYSVSESFRIGLFQLISSYTTTGYQVIPDIAALPTSIIFMTIILMFIGGEAGSTAGGVKQIRVVSFLKGIVWDVKKTINKGRVIETHFINQAGKYVEITDIDRKRNNDFFLIMIVITIIATLIITCFGYDVQSALFEVVSAFSSSGLSVGVATYDAHPVVLWTISIIMFLGRLEIYVVFYAFVRMFQLSKDSWIYTKRMREMSKKNKTNA